MLRNHINYKPRFRHPPRGTNSMGGNFSDCCKYSTAQASKKRPASSQLSRPFVSRRPSKGHLVLLESAEAMRKFFELAECWRPDGS